MNRAPTKMEMRCARAFAKREALDFDSTAPDYQAFALDRVRSVIRAMREPTEDMAHEARPVQGWDPETIWSLMIDVASPPLKPQGLGGSDGTSMADIAEGAPMTRTEIRALSGTNAHIPGWKPR